jgi:hypothetical protein
MSTELPEPSNNLLRQILEEMQRANASNRLWSKADVAHFLGGKNALYVDQLIEASRINGFPSPRSTTVMKARKTHESQPLWCPKEVRAWWEAQPRVSPKVRQARSPLRRNMPEAASSLCAQ